MRTISVRVGFMAAALGIAGLFQVFNAPTSLAAPNPDSCFTTTGVATRTITDYNFAGAGCGATVEIPSTISGGTVVSIGSGAFGFKGLTSVILPSTMTSLGVSSFINNQLTSIIIPNSVISIGQSAFYGNQLTSVTIPDSVTTIGNSAFYNNELASVSISNSITSIGNYTFGDNKLTSVIIPSTVTSIGNGAFEANKLTSVTIPSSVTSVNSGAFDMQSHHGSDIWILLYDADMAVVNSAVDSIWYARLYTADPSNPQGFTDGISFEEVELDGLDNDYNDQFNAGGYLINPTSAELQFIDGSNNQLLDPVILTGQSIDSSTYYYDYLVKNGPTVPLPVNTYAPTAPELQAAQTALAQYYRAGSTLSYIGVPVNGVAPTPASYSFVLGANAEDNERQFVYAANTSTPSSGQLSNTGTNVWMIVAIAGAVIVGSVRVLARR